MALVATTTHKTWTDPELLALPNDGKYELVDGELLYMSPAGYRHGRIIAELLFRIRLFVQERNLGGAVLEGQTGYRLSPDGNLRSPDLSYIAASRLPEGQPTGFLHIAPDLAAEVLSPDDRAGQVAHKVAEYLAGGVTLLWVIDPEARSAVVYRPAKPPRTVREGDTLEGEDVLPGFSYLLRDLLG